MICRRRLFSVAPPVRRCDLRHHVLHASETLLPVYPAWLPLDRLLDPGASRLEAGPQLVN